MFRALFDTMPHVTWLHAEDLETLVYVNVAFERVFGSPRSVLTDAPLAWLEWVHSEDRERLRASLEARGRSRAAHPLGEFRVVRPGGEIRWLRSSIRRIENTEPGGPVGTFWIETALDVTREREAAQRSRGDREFVEKVVRLMGAIVVVTDSEMRVASWNDRFAELCGGAPDRMKGRHVADVLFQDQACPAAFSASLAALGPDQSQRVGAHRFELPDDDSREIEWCVAWHAETPGSPPGLLCAGRDVTAENREKRERHKVEERLAGFVRNLPDVPWLYSVETGDYIFVGPGRDNLWGTPRVPGRGATERLLESVHPDDCARVKESIEATLRSDRATTPDVEYRIVRPDGEVRAVLSRAAPLRDDRGKVVEIAGLTIDVTSMRETTRALAESEERFRQMGETIQEVFFLVSPDRTRVLYVNEALERIWGISREALYADIRVFLDAVHPEDREAMRQSFASLQASGIVPGIEEREYRIVRPDGGIRWVAARSYPVFDRDGSARGVVGLNTDITARKQAELALRERTQDLERLLREKHALLAEVHHRVKNNLQSISGLTHMMAASAHRRSIGEAVEEIDRRIQTIALVHEMLYRSASLVDVDMQTYLERIAEAQSALIEAGPDEIDIRVEVSRGITLDLDGAMRCGLIVNELVSNSIKHAFPRSRSGHVVVTMERKSESHFVLRVADDGVGLPEELDFASESTLGLRLVAGLAEQLGGVARCAGKRAIEIEFPAADHETMSP